MVRLAAPARSLQSALRMCRWLAGLLVMLAGCVGSSVPQPPALEPLEPSLAWHRTEEDAGFFVVEGRPGAI